MRRLYYFYGGERFLIKDEVLGIRKKLSGGGPLINIEYFDPESLEMDRLLPDLCTPSLFSGERLSVLEDYDDDDLEKLLGQYGSMPASMTIVIIREKPDKRTSVFKKLAAMAEVREFKPFAEWEEDLVAQWIISRTAACSRTISRKTASKLNSISGPSLAQLASEIDKLITYAGDRKEITEEDVDSLAVSGDLGAFALESALAERDLKGAMEALHEALRSKESPQMLVGKIYGRLRLYLKIKSLSEKRIPRQQILGSMGMNPYFFERCLKSSELYSLDELVRSVKVISDTDISIKNTMQSPQTLMEIMLVEILSKKGAEKADAKKN